MTVTRSRYPLIPRTPLGTALALGVFTLGFFGGTPAAASGITALLADGRTLENVRVLPGAAGDQVRLTRPAAPEVTVPAPDLLVLDFGKTPGQSSVPTARFANGDQVHGAVTFPNARQVKISAGWGTLTAPLAWCSALRLDEKAALPPPAGRDAVVLANDRADGEIQSIEGGKVHLLLSGKRIALDLARVHALAFGPRPRTPDESKGLLVSLDLGGGERLTGRWVRLGEDVLTVRLAWGGTVDVPVASLARLEVKNGRLVYLSDLKPSESRQIPYLDQALPPRADLAVSGRPLRLRGRPYRRGLGVHSRSELTYALDGGYREFAATVGIDDAVGGSGSVVFRVFGDEKLLFETGVVRGGEPAVEIKVPVRGVLLLRLEADFGDEGDVADHADWAEARLLRP